MTPDAGPPGTGWVADLQAAHSARARRYSWSGATRLFSPSADGDFEIAEPENLLIPRARRIGRPNEWYVMHGFDFDNREVGALRIEAQPTLERQAGGSFLLVREGRLRAVSES